ncbi:YrhB domain-containing protein [Streptomyces sp. NPDC101206]|uniref:YrhB domain-containing protein n=1 Tax=Streptomyces sp. NPDC101206 TaxID=3366128 RepID=UPI00381CC68F
MIARDEAVRIVEEELARERRARAARGVGQPRRTVVVDVREHELVWLVLVQSEEYARTRDRHTMLVGHGPYLVDRLDGGLHCIGAVSAVTGAWEDDYRSRIRGLPVRRTAVDDLHDELRAAAGAGGDRMAAARVLRWKLPALSPAEARAYVTGLLAGEVPPRLLAVAQEELVRPLSRVLAVRTLVPGTGATGTGSHSTTHRTRAVGSEYGDSVRGPDRV